METVSAVIFRLSFPTFCTRLQMKVTQRCLTNSNFGCNLITETRLCAVKVGACEACLSYQQPNLSTPHWFPLPVRIDFKVLLITFKQGGGEAHKVLSALLQVEPLWQLKSKGDGAFAIRAIQPEKLRLTGSACSFKTHFIGFPFIPHVIFLIYLIQFLYSFDHSHKK